MTELIIDNVCHLASFNNSEIYILPTYFTYTFFERFLSSPNLTSIDIQLIPTEKRNFRLATLSASQGNHSNYPS